MSHEQKPPAPGNQLPDKPAASGSQTAAQPAATKLTPATAREIAAAAVVPQLASASLPANMGPTAHLPTATSTGAVAVAAESADLHGAHGVEACANCGALVTGHFCANCGQRREHEIHSIWHFTQEATEDLTHADSRLWSTMIALLFKPGLLTREFLAGRRVKYLPPLRLYLVLSVLFFLVLGSGSHEPKAISYQASDGKVTFSMVNPDAADGIAARPGETPEARADRVCNPDYDGPGARFVVPFLRKGCRQSLRDNGHTVGEATLHNIPRAMFIFVPALAIVMKLMYWRPRRYYIEHLLFFVHNHAFIFALFGLYALVLRIVPAALDDWIQLVVWGYTAYYLFVSMRRVYGQGRFITFLKYTALSFTYLFGAALTLALTVTYSVYAL